MNKPVDLPLSRVSDEENSNTSNNPSFASVLDARLSRRSLLRGGVGTAATALFGSFGLAACGGGGDGDAAPAEKALGFTAVPKSLADVVSVPAGYSVSILYALGDPLTANTPAYKNDGTDTDFENRAGDHHDGMEWFGLSATGTAAGRLGGRHFEARLGRSRRVENDFGEHAEAQGEQAGAQHGAGDLVKLEGIHRIEAPVIRSGS